MTDQYNPAEVHEVGMATDMILGEKSLPMLDTIMGDDPLRRPEAFAECDE